MRLESDHWDENAAAAVLALGDDDRGQQSRRDAFNDEARAVAHAELRPHVADEDDDSADLEQQTVLLQAGGVVLVAQLGVPDPRSVIDRTVDAQALVQGAGHSLEHSLVDLIDVVAFWCEHRATCHVPARTHITFTCT